METGGSNAPIYRSLQCRWFSAVDYRLALMDLRSARQSFLGPQSQQAFSELRVAIVGLGGGGSHIAQQLAHLGVGHFVLFDPDRIEESNLNRLVGGTSDDVRRSEWKADISSRVIRLVNPTTDIVAIT